MDEISQNIEPAAATLPEEVLKDKRAISLYWIAIGALAAVPVLSILGLLLAVFIGREVPVAIITLIGTASSTALGGLVSMVATQGGGSNNGG